MAPPSVSISNKQVPVRFAQDDAFHRLIKARIDRYFRRTGLSPRDSRQMYLKSAIILTWFAASYILLVFVAANWWSAGLLAVSMGLAMSAVGFNIMHDGGHKAYSDRGWLNRLAAMTVDMIGGSSFLWDHKHNTIHHTYPNIDGHDDDIDVGFLGRLAPSQKRLPFHRYQHIYLWPLYGLLAIKWHLVDDFVMLIRGKIGVHKFTRPRGWDLAWFVGGKLLFATLAFILPMLFHPWWAVLLLYGVTAVVLGIVMSVVFQLAHVVEDAHFPVPEPVTGKIHSHWAVHQIYTTVDFARDNPFLTWFLGGLNFQIEHHLFPRVSHVHYPKLSRLVKNVCAKFDLPYNEHPTFFAGVANHYRWLRQMGRPTT
jgi:linoleoyl-CoA desaturase